jgi:hypothetical protein
MEETTHRIACMRCKHYHTTFEPNTPRGCKLFQFKSALMPYILVKQSTGTDCKSFEERQTKKADDKDSKKDFNDPRYW